MTKKEYFRRNIPRASLCVSAFAYYALYGVEYGVNDYAYIAYETASGVRAEHKLLVRYTQSGDTYVLLYGRRLKLSEFCRI